MDNRIISNGHYLGLDDCATSTHDTTGEQLKKIRQLVQKLQAKSGRSPGNQAINQLYSNWSKLNSLCEKVYSLAVNYNHIDYQPGNQTVTITPPANTGDDDNNNYKETISKYNGVKSLIKVVGKFVHHVENGLDDNGSKIVDCETLNQVTEFLTHLIELTSDLSTTFQSIGTGKRATLFLLDTYMASRDKLTPGIKAYWSHYPAFWLDKDAQWVQTIFSIWSSSLSSLPFSLMTLVSRSAHGYWQEGLIHSSNPYYPLNLANYVHNPLFSSLNWISCKKSGLSITEILIPRQKNWHIPFDEEKNGDGKVKFIPDPLVTSTENEKPLKCRLIHQAGIKPNGNIIFHVQGGAFVVDVPILFDQCFRHWAPHLEGAVILDVYYSRFVRYPVQLQELLDVFLWLTNYESNPDVQSSLGFIPKKIIFCGDSAGGLFLFSLVTILRDMQLLSSSSSPSFFEPPGNGLQPFPNHLYPKAFVTFYPVLSITIPTAQPSLILSFLDQFLNPLTILNCLSLYSSGVIFDSECTNLDTPDSSRYLKPSWWETFYNTWLGKRKIWLQCDKETLDQRIEVISEAAIRGYKSPLTSYNLDLIKDLNIHLIVGEFDPFLDTNIEFSQKWPGKITLDVLDDLNHGFLALTYRSPKSYQAAKICLKRILEALKD